MKGDKNVKSKAKAEAVNKVMDHYKCNQSLSFIKAAIIYRCSKKSISNYIKPNSSIRHSSNVYNNYQSWYTGHSLQNLDNWNHKGSGKSVESDKSKSAEEWVHKEVNA